MKLSSKERLVMVNILEGELFRQGSNDEYPNETYVQELLKLVSKLENSIKAK